ncbi:hypothetical protein QYM36_018955 [Artemia franciscana]|uniref:Uncharacterized protein n=1 Tax=Artemia franciscana TaxID=6661 RepID=A0AA88KU49_ARTSF|nr:hypothetical protein QYM36_018955 [Artemia franciscana]
MDKLSVIEKVSYTTDWVNTAVVVEKPDKSVWACIDLYDLNKANKIPHHPIPTFDALIFKHSGAKFFKKLDNRYGCWSLILDLGSLPLTTFKAPHGPYKFNLHYVWSDVSTGGNPKTHKIHN